MFLDQFNSYFSAEQRQTELYKIWSAIGVNMEKAILEEQNKLNAEMTDINVFSEDTMRSWLSFFLTRIPYRISSTTQITVTMNSDTGQVTVPKYSQLKTPDGIIYTTLTDLILSHQGDSIDTQVVQGQRIVEQGTYSKMIKVQATNPDLTYLTVQVDGVDIPEVSFTSSYDYMSFIGSWSPDNTEEYDYGGTPHLLDSVGTKGQWYQVMKSGTCKFSADGIPVTFRQGDIVVYNGEKWGKLLEIDGLNPLQYQNNYAIPSNGYYAYYYDNFLYIKIFSGTTVVNPEGKQYTISYINSDGIQGEILEDTLDFISGYEDIQNNPVDLVVNNTRSTPATNEPSVGKLGLALKQRLFANVSISSVPEYTMWFKAQPEVGDCIVESDWERYLNSDRTTFVPTGIINVYACDYRGNDIESSVKEKLLERIEPYKDVGMLQFDKFTKVQHILKYEYTTATSEELYKQYIISQSSLYYDVTYLQSDRNSIFKNLDLAYVLQNVLNNSPYESTGLRVKGYHYYEQLLGSGRNAQIEAYDGEEIGAGEYLLVTDILDEQGNPKTYRFIEYAQLGTTDYANIYDAENTSHKVGERYKTSVTLNFTAYLYNNATLKCYWGMKDEGILTIGKQGAIRELKDVIVSRSDS